MKKRRRYISTDSPYTGLPPTHYTYSSIHTHVLNPVPEPDPEPEPEPHPDPEPLRVVHQPRIRFSSTLPDSLTKLGNKKAWFHVLEHLRVRRHVPLIVWGPIGCGKSMGCRVLLEHCGFRVLTLDGADGDDNQQLMRWIRQTRQMKHNTDGEQTVVLLDDLESFTEMMRKDLVAYFSSQDGNRCLGGLLLTATQLRDPLLKDLVTLDNVRLFPPFPRQLETWFALSHPWKVTYGETTKSGVGFGWAEVKQIADVIETRDIRRIEQELQLRQRGWKRSTSKLAFDNIFNATRELFSPEGDWKHWAQYAEERDLGLLREHAPTYTHVPDWWTDGDKDPMHVVAHTLDHLSTTDNLHPRSFELHLAQLPYKLTIGAMAMAATTRSRGVGALAPPARLTTRLDRQTERCPHERPLDRMEHLDRPTTLGGPALCRDPPSNTFGSSRTRATP